MFYNMSWVRSKRDKPSNEILEVLDAEVGKGEDAVFTDAVDPDASVLDLHFVGNVKHPIFVLAEFPGDAIDRRDVMDLVNVHGQAARSKAGGVQCHGSSSSSR